MKGLTVEELIEELRKLPQKAKVVRLTDGYIAGEYNEIGGVEVMQASLATDDASGCCRRGHWCGWCHHGNAQDVVVLHYGNSLIDWEETDG